MYTNKVNYEFLFNLLCSLILVFVVCTWQTVSFSHETIPPKYGCTDEFEQYRSDKAAQTRSAL